MSNNVSIEDFAKAISNLPPEYQAELQKLTGVPAEANIQPVETVDVIGIRFELVKFVSELRKHNQAIDWETNKLTPKKIDPEGIILDAQKLFDFIVG